MPKKGRASGFESLNTHIQTLASAATNDEAPNAVSAQRRLTALRKLITQSEGGKKDYATYLGKKACKSLLKCLEVGPSSGHRLEAARLLMFMSLHKSSAQSLVNQGLVAALLPFLPSGSGNERSSPLEGKVDVVLLDKLVSVLANSAFHKENIAPMTNHPELVASLAKLTRSEWGSACGAQAFTALANLANAQSGALAVLQNGGLNACVHNGVCSQKPEVIKCSLLLLLNLALAAIEEVAQSSAFQLLLPLFGMHEEGVSEMALKIDGYLLERAPSLLAAQAVQLDLTRALQLVKQAADSPPAAADLAQKGLNSWNQIKNRLAEQAGCSTAQLLHSLAQLPSEQSGVIQKKQTPQQLSKASQLGTQAPSLSHVFTSSSTPAHSSGSKPQKPTSSKPNPRNDDSILRLDQKQEWVPAGLRATERSGVEIEVVNDEVEATSMKPRGAFYDSGDAETALKVSLELPSGRLCDGCKRSSALLGRCGGCLLARFCSRACHRDHWAEHRSFCLLYGRKLTRR
eukprot:gb/GEZN01004124.1/.p1 GENE.gb/GEZN01004124.1/~~gb/GEZN01004124.1/.p1  ORF type:complete len:516 (+),score=63.43 gb/GEZN01004124.1/:82-1629(+)